MHIKRRLTVGGLGQLFDWPVPRDRAQLALEHFISAPEKISGDRELFRQVLSHSNHLRALPGKEKCNLSAHDRAHSKWRARNWQPPIRHPERSVAESREP